MMNTAGDGKSVEIKNIDIFAFANTALFLLMCIFTYYDRFIQFRGRGNLHEFLIYGAAILSAIAFLWASFRHAEFETPLLLWLQLGILAHFSGAFVEIDGGRLYDCIFFGLRFDKYVHFTNAFVGSMLVAAIFKSRGIRFGAFTSVIMILTVLGLGAVVEIIEYGVVQTVEHTGVGGYDNNMQDLLANLTGSLMCLIFLNMGTFLHQTKRHSQRVVAVDEEHP